MRNKGFTLIELLGVIIILALITILVFPNIINSIKNSTDKTDELTIDLINSGADTYILNHKNDFPKDNGNKFSIDLSELVAEGLLVSPIKYGKDNDITNTKCVQVTYNNENFNYELKNTGECVNLILKICKLQEGSSEAVGSKYICSLDEDRIFYVLENDESSENISIIMDRNFEDAITWITNSDYTKAGGTQADWNNHTNITKYGPITVNKYLSDQTSDWGVTVSLPSKDQIVSANNGSTTNLPGWLIQNLNSDNWSLTQYWTSTPNDNLYQVYHVAENGLKDNFGAWGQLGVRPVITIPKNRLD